MSGPRSLRLVSGPRDKMADLSLDELIRKRGVTVKGSLPYCGFVYTGELNLAKHKGFSKSTLAVLKGLV